MYKSKDANNLSSCDVEIALDTIRKSFLTKESRAAFGKAKLLGNEPVVNSIRQLTNEWMLDFVKNVMGDTHTYYELFNFIKFGVQDFRCFYTMCEDIKQEINYVKYYNDSRGFFSYLKED